jgi:porin
LWRVCAGVFSATAAVITRKPTMTATMRDLHLGLAALTIVLSPVRATDENGERKTEARGLAQSLLTGDWGGSREILSDRGVTLTINYTTEAMANVSGGIRRGTVYNGLLELGMSADLEKLIGWTGGTLHLHTLYPHGTSLSENYLGDLGTATNLEFYDSYRLYEFWFEQNFFDERVSVRVGQLAADEEFWVSEYALLFINSGFGPPTALTANMPVPIYAIAAPGARLRVEPIKGFTIQFAAYDGNPAPGALGDFSPDAPHSNEFNHYGTHFALRGNEGALLAAEVGYRFNQPEIEDATQARVQGHTDVVDEGDGARGLAGSYKAGITYHTDTFSNIYDATLNASASSLVNDSVRGLDGNYVLSFIADQELFREHGSDSEGLGVFLRGTFAPRDRNFISHSIDGGFRYVGAITGRGEDELGLGVGYYRVSDRVARAVREVNRAEGMREAEPDYELVIELTYNIHATPSISIQPDFQYIIHPGGSGSRENAVVFGLRASFAF